MKEDGKSYFFQKNFFRNFVFFLNQCGSPPCFLDQIKNFFLRSRRLSVMCEFITGQMSFLITRMTKQVHTYKLSGTFWVRSPKWWHWGKPKFADANALSHHYCFGWLAVGVNRVWKPLEDDKRFFFENPRNLN